MSAKVEKWDEISRRLVFEKYGRKIDRVVFRLPNGKEADYYIKREGPTVAVVALTKEQEVILTRQYRPGPGEILLELPGGFIDPNEKPEDAVERELAEEAGYRGKVQFVAMCFNDAYSSMKKYCYVATNCEMSGELKMDEQEFTEVKVLPLKDFRKLLRSGKMTDLEAGYLGLDFLNLL